MKNLNQFSVDKLNRKEEVCIDGGCEIQDPDHGKPETLWDKIWDIITR